MMTTTTDGRLSVRIGEGEHGRRWHALARANALLAGKCRRSELR